MEHRDKSWRHVSPRASPAQAGGCGAHTLRVPAEEVWRWSWHLCFTSSTASDASAAPDQPRANHKKGEIPQRCRKGLVSHRDSMSHISLHSQPEICSSYSYLLFIPQKAQLGLVFKPQQFKILFPTPVPWERSTDQPDFSSPPPGVWNDRPSAPWTLFQCITQVI